MKVTNNYNDEEWKWITVHGKKTDFIISNYGRIFNRNSNKFVKSFPSKKGYYTSYLRLSKEKYARVKIHRLVGLNFVYNDDPIHKTQIDHIDGNKAHNSASNLEWVTPKENVRRAFSTGLHPVYTCEKSPHAKKSNKEIKDICEFMMNFPEIPLKEISKRFNIGYATLQNLRLHRSWKEISMHYDFPVKHKVHKSDKIKDEIDLMISSGYEMEDIIKHINWPKDFSPKDKYNTVYYRYKKS